MNARIRLLLAVGTLFLAPALIVTAAPEGQDPGPRGGPARAGGPLPNLTPGQLSAFTDGADDFNTSHSVDGSIRDADATGLGPTFNLENCGGCHATPSIGGSSPERNPQFESALVAGGANIMPSFLQRNGPVREARFITNPDGSPDGSVHSLFTIAGRSDAPGCTLKQPDFETEHRRGNVIFRIPTPTFGDGLIENIPEAEILANKASAASEKTLLGIK